MLNYKLHKSSIYCRAIVLDGIILGYMFLLFCPSLASLTCMSAKASWWRDSSHWQKQREWDFKKNRQTIKQEQVCFQSTHTAEDKNILQCDCWRQQCDWMPWTDDACSLSIYVHYSDWCSLDSSAAGERKTDVCVWECKQQVKSFKKTLWRRRRKKKKINRVCAL